MKQINRLVLVDALRGFALLLIILIHYVEHFDFFLPPEVQYFFSAQTDKLILERSMQLISGRAYSIFALLFGFSFFIQLDRREQRGEDFRWRFLWRLTILLTIGFLHSLFYKGDILNIYATLGFILVLFYKVNTKIVAFVGVLLLMQLPLIHDLYQSFTVSDFKLDRSFGGSYWAESTIVYRDGNLLDVLSFNFWKGRATVWGWSYYNGRFYQLLALFLFGLILGRKRIFENLEQHTKNFIIAFSIALAVYLGITYVDQVIKTSVWAAQQKTIASEIIGSYKSLLVTVMSCAVIVLIFIRFSSAGIFQFFANFGRMSLTNYVSQSLIGIISFYGFGLAWYKYLGAGFSLSLGFIVFLLQAWFASYWMSKYHYGPLEWLWRALTHFDFSIKFKK